MGRNCSNCKFRLDLQNTEETKYAICSFGSRYFPVQTDKECRFLQDTELTCGKCVGFGEDAGCLECEENQSILHNGRVCNGFVDIREASIKEILISWVQNGIYNRSHFESMLDDFEKYELPKYKYLMEEESDE